MYYTFARYYSLHIGNTRLIMNSLTFHWHLQLEHNFKSGHSPSAHCNLSVTESESARSMSAGRDLLSCNPTSCSELVQLDQVAPMLTKFSVFPGAESHQPLLTGGPAPVSAQPSGKKEFSFTFFIPHTIPLGICRQPYDLPLAFSS